MLLGSLLGRAEPSQHGSCQELLEGFWQGTPVWHWGPSTPQCLSGTAHPRSRAGPGGTPRPGEEALAPSQPWPSWLEPAQRLHSPGMPALGHGAVPA